MLDTDSQLLEAYARTGSERAFRELVDRHINLVHSAALRESRGNVPLAEDITQAVFTELARRTTRLVRHPALAGWLYTCVRLTSANLHRAEDRRRRREQEASTMNELLGPDPTDILWRQVRPLLDDVMHQLNEADRTVVVLRFFEGRSLKDVGQTLGLTENAARMRVERSLEKLRGLLTQRGVKSTASTLAAVLAVGAVLTAPSALASTVATSALATAASGSSAAFALKNLFGVSKGIIAAAGASLLLVAAVAFWHHVPANRGNTEPVARAQLTAPAGASSVAGDSRAKNDSTSGTAVAPTNSVAPSPMAFQLVDAETGQPLPGAKLHLYYYLEDGRGKVVKAVTDVDGRAGVDQPQPPYHGLNFFVTADGHVPKVISWDFRGAMPAEYTMKLEPGVTIGGVVVDEAGQPIAGAKIEIVSPGNDMSLAENIEFSSDATLFTDAGGHWSCNMIPKSYEKVSLNVTHPEHAETDVTIHPGAADANNAVITMKAGFAVAGIVQDANGNPLAGAKVRDVRENSKGEHSKTTDDSGAFGFKNLKDGELIFAVQANGFAPALQTLMVTDSVSGLRFQLGHGQLLRGRVADEDGNPLTNAFVEVTRQGFNKVQWSTNTDSEGRFVWDSAPTEPLAYSFVAEGFNQTYALTLPADGSEHEIKLARHQPDKDTVQITGTVVDAETGQPVDTFNVMVGDLDPEWAYPFWFFMAGKDGQFSLSLPVKSNHPGYQVQIEKEGYQPAASANLSRKGGNQTLEFKMQKGSGPSGVVLLPSGGPAANADVLLCTTRTGVTLDGPAHVQKGLNTTTYRTQTDSTGKFMLPAAVDPAGVIIIHDQAYGEFSVADLATTGSVTLQPWGRVEGRLVLDSQPAANARVGADNQVLRYDDTGRHFSFLTYTLGARTDANGRFTFDKVPPGQCRIARLLEAAPRARIFASSHTTLVMVNAGTVTQVTLGGGGRPITGKAVAPNASVAIDWETVTVSLNPKTGIAPGPRPQRSDYSSVAAYVAASEHFFGAYRTIQYYNALCDSSGSFRLQDVPSGTYELAIHVRKSNVNSVSTDRSAPGENPDIAYIVQEVIVPEIPDGQSAEPLDLGTLQLVPTQNTDSLP